MDARIGRRQKRLSLKQERDVAADLSGRTLPASGGTRHGGGSDVVAEGIVNECKYTEKSQYTLRVSELRKIRETALRSGLKMPVLTVDFIAAHDVGARRERYAIIRWDDFRALWENQK